MIVEARDITLEAARRALEVIRASTACEGATAIEGVTLDGIED
jgi:hypothetical protein